MRFVDALNALHINVWGVALIGLGVVLIILGHEAVGGTVVTGGFALLQSNGVNGQAKEKVSDAPMAQPKA